MKEDFNILENALLFAPAGTPLWSDVYGWVKLGKYHDRQYLTTDEFPFSTIHVVDGCYSLNGHYGGLGMSDKGRCVLWPSENHRTWVNWQGAMFKPGDFVYNTVQKKVLVFRHHDTNGLTYSGVLSDGEVTFGALGDCRYASVEQIDEYKKWGDKLSAYKDLVTIAIKSVHNDHDTDTDINCWNGKYGMGLSADDVRSLICHTYDVLENEGYHKL